MILKNMISFCKKARTVNIVMFGADKYLSDGVMFSFIGDKLADWGTEDILTAMDLDAEEAESFRTATKEEDGIEYDPKIYESVLPIDYAVVMNDITLQPFICGKGKVIYIDMKRLKVFSDDKQRLYYYSDQIGKIPALYIIRFDKVIGIIPSVKIYPEQMIEFGKIITAGAEFSQRTGFIDAGGQISL